jgi:hypothetical protein
MDGQGELAHIVVFIVKMQNLEIVCFKKFDTTFGFKNMKKPYWNLISNRKGPNRSRFLFIFSHPSPKGTSVWINSPWAFLLPHPCTLPRNGEVQLVHRSPYIVWTRLFVKIYTN